MKYAMVEGVRSEALPRAKGLCCACGNPTVAKCGEKILWHWAHVSRKMCDKWWENETAWHRRWKSYFPDEFQEIVHFDEATGEKHIADVKTANGMVIEFQNSPMSPQEMRSREEFYGKMIWILNGDSFRNNFFIFHKLPDPKSAFDKDIFFLKYTAYKHRLLFRQGGYVQKCPDYSRWSSCTYHEDGIIGTHSIETDDISKEIEPYYTGHHSFDWLHPRTVWYEATKPVFIDFGGPSVWWLQIHEARTGLMCIRRIQKRLLIAKNGGRSINLDDPFINGFDPYCIV